MPVSTGDIHLSYSFKASADARPGYALLPGIDLELLGAPGLTGSSGHPSCARRQTKGPGRSLAGRVANHAEGLGRRESGSRHSLQSRIPGYGCAALRPSPSDGAVLTDL